MDFTPDHNMIASITALAGLVASAIALYQAHKANRASEAANELSRKALNIGSDQIEYRWNIMFEKSSNTLKLTNECASIATEIAVTITHESKPIHTFSRTALLQYESTTVHTPEIGSLIDKEVAWRDKAARDSQVTLISPVFGIDINVEIAWTSELGVRRNVVLDKHVR